MWKSTCNMPLSCYESRLLLSAGLGSVPCVMATYSDSSWVRLGEWGLLDLGQRYSFKSYALSQVQKLPSFPRESMRRSLLSAPCGNLQLSHGSRKAGLEQPQTRHRNSLWEQTLTRADSPLKDTHCEAGTSSSGRCLP